MRKKQDDWKNRKEMETAWYSGKDKRAWIIFTGKIIMEERTSYLVE